MSLLLLVGFHSISNGEERSYDYSDISFNTHLDRKILLNKYGKKALESEGEEKKQYLRLYFRSLPRDFETFFKTLNSNCHGNIIYKNYTSPYGYSRNPWGKFHPITKFVKTKEEIPKEGMTEESQQYLASLKLQGAYEHMNIYFFPDNICNELVKVIPRDIYCEKIISLCMGGWWDADDISFLQQHLFRICDLEDFPNFLHILEKRTDDEIASFWFFYYDDIGQVCSKGELYQKIETLNPRIAKLMDRAYTALLADREETSALGCVTAYKHAFHYANDLARQAKLIEAYYQKAVHGTGKAQVKYQKLFFEVFPSSFINYVKWSTYKGDVNTKPEYWDNYGYIRLFRDLSAVIDKETYYNKIIDIYIGGRFGEESMIKSFCLGGKLLTDTEACVAVISKRSREELLSAFYFMLDDPFPRPIEEENSFYKEIYRKVIALNPMLATIMEEAYRQVLCQRGPIKWEIIEAR
eukprot:gene4022-5028_t